MAPTADDPRYLAKCEGDELGVADRQTRAREIAAVIATHYGVGLPEIRCGYVRRNGLATYYPARGVNGLLSLSTDGRIHTGNICRIVAHEMTHHLDHVLWGNTGMNAAEAHGPEFAGRMAEILRVISSDA
jgi:hypothetical protein